jgi:tRNA (cytidine/uridine-2'-O-)-methyltransferase
MSLHVILVQPEIPPNTGNVARLCAATRTPLHLVHPLGFRTDEKSLRRAGLDYWRHVEVHHHPSFADALAGSGEGPVLLFSARAGPLYTEAPYAPGARLVFGRETAGLPEEILAAHPGRVFRLPIWGEVRSLNLSTAVGIVVYEAYRRIGFGPEGDGPEGNVRDVSRTGEEPSAKVFAPANGIPGKIYLPEGGGAKKHPCPDCLECQWCADSRCAMCRRE